MRLKSFKDFKNAINESHETESDIAEVKWKIKEIKRKRKELDRDMNTEAGQRHMDPDKEWTDDDANKYGIKFNELDDEEVKLRKELEALVKKLEKEDDEEFIGTTIDDFHNTIEAVANPEKFKTDLKEDGIIHFEVTIDGEEFEFGAEHTGAVFLKEEGKRIYFGDVDDEEAKDFLKKILSLEGQEYKDFISTFEEE